MRAKSFAKKHGVKLTAIGKPVYNIHFPGETQMRWVYKMRLTRNGKSYTFNFGQSIRDGKAEPTMYDVLACIEKYDVGSYEEFLNEFGYRDSMDSRETYKAVVREYKAVNRLFGDIMDELQEIR